MGARAFPDGGPIRQPARGCNAGVRTEKAGRVRTCQLEPAGLEVAVQWIGGCRTEWARRLDRLSAFLDEEG